MTITRYSYDQAEQTLTVHTLDAGGEQTLLLESITLGERCITSAVIFEYGDHSMPGMLPRPDAREWLYTTLFLLGLKVKSEFNADLDVDWSNPAGWLIESGGFGFTLSQSQQLSGRLALGQMLGMGFYRHVEQFASLWQLELGEPVPQGLPHIDWLELV